MAKRQHPERDEQENICSLVRSLGGHVYRIGTVRKRGDHQGTMQTPGIPDLWIVLPEIRRTMSDGVTPIDLPCIGLWWETKAPKGKLSEPQRHFLELAEAAGVDHGHGTFDEFIEWLVVGNRLDRQLVH